MDPNKTTAKNVGPLHFTLSTARSYNSRFIHENNLPDNLKILLQKLIPVKFSSFFQDSRYRLYYFDESVRLQFSAKNNKDFV